MIINDVVPFPLSFLRFRHTGTDIYDVKKWDVNVWRQKVRLPNQKIVRYSFRRHSQELQRTLRYFATPIVTMTRTALPVLSRQSLPSFWEWYYPVVLVFWLWKNMRHELLMGKINEQLFCATTSGYQYCIEQLLSALLLLRRVPNENGFTHLMTRIHVNTPCIRW